MVRNRIQDKLSITFSAEPIPKEAVAEIEDPEIVTTDSEKEGFMIVRAIAAKIASVERINLRDAKSYCAILMDDNNRKPVCRLYFNSEKNLSIGLFDAQKVETKFKIEQVSDIYQHAGAIEG